MNQRERILALVVGLCLLVLAAFFGTRKLNEALRARRQQIAAAEEAIRDKTQVLRLSAEPDQHLEDYQRRSLPSDLERARSLYQTWLLNLVKEAGFEDTQVSVLPEIVLAWEPSLKAVGLLAAGQADKSRPSGISLIYFEFKEFIDVCEVILSHELTKIRGRFDIGIALSG